MHVEEARWLADRLGSVPAPELGPLLDIGSSTEEFRTRVQPWIHDLVFRPLRARGVPVLHQDVRAGAGIDLRGDLSDPAFREALADHGFRSVICCNLMEHVEQPLTLLRWLADMVAPGGRLLVTVPWQYPYHADPDDTRYRPSPEELAASVPGTRVLDRTALDVGRPWDDHRGDPRSLLKLAARTALPWPRPLGWWTAVNRTLWMFRPRRISAVFLQEAVRAEAS